MARFGALFLLVTVSFLSLGHVRSESGLIHAFDTGLYLQLLSNLLAGRGWMSSIVQEPMFLAHHFQPIVLLLLPLHSLAPGTFTLLATGWLAATLASLYLIWQLPQRGLCSRSTASLVSLAMFLHPTLASRMYYSFVPEVLALPALAYLACALATPSPFTWRETGRVLLALIVVGLCKENFWIISAWTALLFAYQQKSKGKRAGFAGLAVIFLALMLYLFFQWMPQHSTMKQYYGLSYFDNSWVDARWGLLGRIAGAVLNMFSVASLAVGAIVLLLIPCGLLLWGNRWTTLAALPTVALVMAASNDQIHDLTNHYLLAALPFLAVSMATGLQRVATQWTSRALHFYLTLAVLLTPAVFTLMHPSGFLFQALFAAERQDGRLRAESQRLRSHLNPDDVILIDGSLQPLFHDLPRVRIIQGFQGNPSPLGPEDRSLARHIITANDLSGVTNCDEVTSDAQGLVRYDLENFLSYCLWLKTQDVEKIEYVPQRLIHLRIK